MKDVLMQVDITKLLLGALEILFGVVVYYLIPYMKDFAKAKLGECRYNQIERFVKIAVKAAEQTYPGSGRGAEKKAAVLAFLSARGFIIDEEELDAFIESAVLDLKNELAA